MTTKGSVMNKINWRRGMCMGALVLAVLGATSLTAVQPASAAMCMVNCWSEDGRWDGGGGLSGGGGGNTGSGAGGSDGGRVGGGGYEGVDPGGSAPSGDGWSGPLLEPPVGLPTAPCGGPTDVYDDHTVITSNCGNATEPVAVDTNKPSLGWLDGTVEACELRRDVMCDLVGLSVGKTFGPVRGLAAEHMCKKSYTSYICSDYPPMSDYLDGKP